MQPVCEPNQSVPSSGVCSVLTERGGGDKSGGKRASGFPAFSEGIYKKVQNQTEEGSFLRSSFLVPSVVSRGLRRFHEVLCVRLVGTPHDTSRGAMISLMSSCV